MDNKNLEETPLCDIIIITWNGLEYTKNCVKSIEENTKNVHYRIIFVDNGSTDRTIEFLSQVKNSMVIRNEKNLGFAKAMNIGFKKVTAKYTVWLNNDTIVTSNWLDKLINYLEDNSKAGAIGPVSNGTGVIQRIEGLKDNNYSAILEFGNKIAQKFKGKVAEYHRIAGFCIVMKSELISKVGYIDEQFNHGGYDDDDYCRRIREEGFKILIAEDVFVYHKSGVSFSSVKDPDFDLQYLMPLGRRRLLRKRYPNPMLTAKTEDNPLVSIIMTTVNRKKIIKNAMKSVIRQTYQNWELLVINDGGENIQNIVDSFGDPRIKYIHLQENHGKSFANNRAIDESSGEIIAYLDDDDRWYPNHIQHGVNGLLANKNRKFVYFDYVKVQCIVDNKTQEQFPTKKIVCENHTARTNFVDEMNFIPNFSMIHRKDLFDLAGKYDTKLDYYEDWDMIRRFSYVSPFVHIPEITGEYWEDIAHSGRNASALHDKELFKTIDYIKNKNKKLENEVLSDLKAADDMNMEKSLESSLRLYEKIHKYDSGFFPAIHGLADRYYTLKKFKQAEEYFDNMLIINPYSYSTYYRYAENQIRQKKHLDAKHLLEDALLIADERSAYYLLAKCYKNLRIEKTAELIERKIKVKVENINLEDVQEFLLRLYNKSSFYRKIMIYAYKILRKLNKNI